MQGNYVQKRGRPNTGYNMIGVAYRMALALGMHREIAHQRQDTVLAERRRRVFWTLFCFDSGLSVTTGRPTTIIDSFMDVRMPRNIDDSVSFKRISVTSRSVTMYSPRHSSSTWTPPSQTKSTIQPPQAP